MSAAPGNATAYSGLRVIEIADDPGAEYTGRLLAEMGADVLKIEPPGGAASRRIGPFEKGAEGDIEHSLHFCFYNADKRSYGDYFERALRLLRTGGLIAFDNTLWGGEVAKVSTDADTLALQALNARLHKDERVDLSLLPIGDGLTLARKRPSTLS